jgi:hypothetical protein
VRPGRLRLFQLSDYELHFGSTMQWQAARKIDEAGGWMAGMPQSPARTEGRLTGALAAAFAHSTTFHMRGCIKFKNQDVCRPIVLSICRVYKAALYQGSVILERAQTTSPCIL